MQDQKAAGTDGGSFPSGSFGTRTLNTVLTNEISGASLASSKITLPAGTYFLQARAPAVSCAGHKAIIYNVTDGANILIGSSVVATASATTGCDSVVNGRFTLASTKDIELKHRCVTTKNSTGLGLAADMGVVEVYAEVMIWKVA